MKEQGVWPIYIPSRGRAGQVLRPPALPVTLVVEEDEAAAYQAAHPGLPLLIIAPGQGIGYTRQRILMDARERGREWFWMLDDDVRRFTAHVPPNTACPTTAAQALTHVQSYAAPRVAVLALQFGGLVWTAKPPYYSDGLPGQSVFAVNTKLTGWCGFRGRFWEDVDFMLQVLNAGLITRRVNSIGFEVKPAGRNKGGFWAERNNPAQPLRQQAMEEMLSRWGTRYLERDDSNPLDLKLKVRWQRLAKDLGLR